ncbi:MAG: endonuclease/exonuclease/phosphatase family protein [Pseudonocardiaceae bacterium]
MSLSLITVNVGAPSPARARRQLEWLAARPEDIFVLTETKATPGSQLLAQGCTAANYSVTFPEHGPGELGIMIISKVATTPDPLTGALRYLPARAAGVIIGTSTGPMRVLGAYVPSRDATLDKTERKKRWIEGFHTALDATTSSVPVLLLGDLNVLEPDHQPEHRQQFAPFEYDFYRALTDRHGLVDAFRHLHPRRVEHSWARRPDLGYRYDHAHCCAQLLPLLQGCDYVHQTRDVLADGSRLTDHSGLAVRLATTATTPLLTSDPAKAITSEPGLEPTLF